MCHPRNRSRSKPIDRSPRLLRNNLENILKRLIIEKIWLLAYQNWLRTLDGSAGTNYFRIPKGKVVVPFVIYGKIPITPIIRTYSCRCRTVG